MDLSAAKHRDTAKWHPAQPTGDPRWEDYLGFAGERDHRQAQRIDQEGCLRHIDEDPARHCSHQKTRANGESTTCSDESADDDEPTLPADKNGR
jgi:hypothetical protein